MYHQLKPVRHNTRLTETLTRRYPFVCWVLTLSDARWTRLLADMRTNTHKVQVAYR